MATTLIGIFDDFTEAQAAVRELLQSGFKQKDVQLVRSDEGKGYATYSGTDKKGKSVGDKISDFFANLFGTDVDESERGIYAEAVRRGSTSVIVNATDEAVDQAADILNRHNAIDIDRRAAQYRASGYKQFDAAQAPYTTDQIKRERDAFTKQGDVAIPVIEEELQVGKRVVKRGGVRVHTRVTERPVEETVTLREERVNVERRPANRPVTDADRAAMKEGEVVMTERTEEPVVAKKARVVEEVVLNKDVNERTETVRDKVRRKDVKVEELDTKKTRSASASTQQNNPQGSSKGGRQK
jgi:uncharacterized protein (TIGR02271 family)